MKVLSVGKLPLFVRNQNTQYFRLLSTTKKDDDYQFLQKSDLPMLFFQKSLPRLPIPKIKNTCERYLSAQKPLLNEEEFELTSTMVHKFGRTSWELQKMLQEKDSVHKHTSYISEPWFEMYLRDRAPLPVNYNPLVLMNPDPKPEYNDQLIRSSNLVISSLRFMKSLRAQNLAPEIYHMNAAKSDTEKFRKYMKMSPDFLRTYAAYAFKAYPLDMSQYDGLFGSTRIPDTHMDTINRTIDSRHLLVMKDGNFYSIDVLDENDNIREPEFIFSQLKYVMSMEQPASKNPLGALTTQNRRVWAGARKHIVALSAKNATNLGIIDSALFCLCLDDTKIDAENPVSTIRNFLFDEAINRWYDKSFSLIVSKDGTTGINFEHSWGDGVAVLRYFNEVYKETTTKPFVHPTTTASVGNVESTVKFLEWDVDAQMENDIKVATETHNNIINGIDMNFLKYEGLNKAECKKYKVSPDSMMQLSFQLGFYKQNKSFVPTYESCSTAAFRHGRTETIRPCTTQTKEFCEQISLASNRPSDKKLRKMLDDCSAKHNQLTKEAAMGQGFDRHLLVLRKMIERCQFTKDFPMFFEDPAYARMNHNILSTSTLTSPALLAGGFGPVVKDGYGIGYNIQNTFLGCVVANYKSDRNGKEFIECLKESYDEMANVIRAKK